MENDGAEKTNEYSELIGISGILKFLGYLTIVVGAIGLLSIIFGVVQTYETPWLAAGFVGALLPAMWLIALAELIKLLIRIERNTRREPAQLKKKPAPPAQAADFEPFEEWAKKNPTKTRNDYYAEKNSR